MAYTGNSTRMSPRHPANDNDRDACPISFAQARHLADLPAYLRGGRI